jgi:hypothetical protein
MVVNSQKNRAAQAEHSLSISRSVLAESGSLSTESCFTAR